MKPHEKFASAEANKLYPPIGALEYVIKEI